MSAKLKKSPARPARDEQEAAGEAAHDADAKAASPEETARRDAELFREASEKAAQAPLESDPWAVASCAGLRAERIIEKCQSGAALRDARGIWRVTPLTLVAMGLSEAIARSAVAMARTLSKCPPDAEGGVVYALSGPGRVAVRSTAERPRSSRVLAQVREPSRLRCGDEVAIRYTESGRCEVIHGR